MIRLHVPGAAEGELRVDGDGFHHLVRVLRVEVGDSLEVFDGVKRAFDAKLVAIEGTSAKLTLGPAREMAALRPITVLQGLPRADKLELVIQKGTEMGATGFIPVACERSVVKIDAASSEKKRERWQKIAEEAARQCGRSDAPLVGPACTLTEALAMKDLAVLVLDEEERTITLSAAFSKLDKQAAVAVLVGPEGGLSRSEIEQCRAAGAQPVTLGRFVLRTETAALAALAVLRHLDGVLG